MAKLWQKNNLSENKLAKKVENFTVGNDRALDKLLAKYDVLGSLAHTKMLAEVGLLSKEDLSPIQQELKTIYKEIELSKSKGEKNIENIFRNDSIMINFRLINDVNENYFINKDGTLFYDIMNVTYKVKIRKELYAELLTSLDQQKHNK